MNAELLLEHFHRLGGTPDAVPRLRRFILDLAVRGKLVKQDAKDEPAEVLLKKIAKEKAGYQTGRKKEFTTDPIRDDEVRFDLPSLWTWARTNDVTVYVQRGKSPKYSQEKKVPVIAQKCVQWAGFELEKAQFIEPASLKAYGAERYVQDGDLLWNSTGHGSLGRIIIFKEQFKGDYPIIVADSHVTVIRPSKLINSGYLFCWFAGPLVQDEINDKSTGTTNQTELPVGTVLAYDIPLPPLAEQHRIVAKVDELMALCDRLEAAQQQRESHRTRFTAATWQQLVADPEPQAARFALKQLPALTTRKEQIPALRQAILDLAVRGKLVQQDEKDEPASVLLKRIAKEKERLVASGELRKKDELKKVVDRDQLWNLPENWAWCAMDETYDITSGIQKTGARTPKDNSYPYLGVSNVYRGRLELGTVKEFELYDGELEKYRLVRGDILLVEGNGSANEVGRCAYWNDEIKDCVHQNHIIRSRALEHGITVYVMTYLNSPLGMENMKALAVTSSGLYNLSVGKIRTIMIPLPPLAEQHRIVAKVDELMALCDRLEAALEKGETAKAKLLGAVLQLETTSAPPQMRQHPATGKAKPQQATYPLPGDALPMAAEPEGERRGPGRPRKAKADGRSATEQAIFGFLKAHPGWHGKNTILEAAGVAANSWNAAIKSLLESGAVERQGEKKGARYRIV